LEYSKYFGSFANSNSSISFVYFELEEYFGNYLINYMAARY